MVAALLDEQVPGPGRRPGAVPRPRLAAAAGRGVARGADRPGSAGRLREDDLLTEWLATLPPAAPAVAWLSLDPRDNDPSLFWTYLVTAIRTAVPGVGSDALQLLASSPPATEAALAALLNDLGGLPADLLLVLDDYHLIEAPEVHEGMTFLLEHQPPQLHVLLATRTDPPLPLARMRARGQLAEVRAADLRFTVEESAAYFNGPMGLRLSDGRRRGAGRADRGVDRGPAAGRAVDAGPRRRQRVHRRVRRGRPLRRGLPRRGGPRPPARRRPRVPARDVDPRAADRPALRRRHRARRRQGDPRGARARQPLPRPARRQAAVVPVPPPVRRRPARAPPRRAARARGRAARAGQRLVRGQRRQLAGDQPRAGGRRHRSSCRPHGARHAG